MSEKTDQLCLDSKNANFIGRQETLSGEVLPLFNTSFEANPSYHSTVSGDTLRSMELRVPPTLSPQQHEISPSPWDHLGIKLNHPKTAKNAAEMAGLNYTVVKKQLKLKNHLKQFAYATVRTDTDEVLGFVNESYIPIQNIDAFTYFDILVADGEVIYETAGVLGKGECMWILARLPGCIKVNGNDIVNKYLLLTNSHDGSSHVRVKVTPIRVVCNNTLTSALQGTGEVQINHSPNTVWNFEQTVAMLGLAKSLYERLEVIFNIMAERKITDEQLREYVHALVPDNEVSENTARTGNIRNSVIKLHDSGRGAHLSHGTLWGAFNSVTEYTDHMMFSGDSNTRLNSIWFGRGEQLKLKAFRLAEEMMS